MDVVGGPERFTYNHHKAKARAKRDGASAGAVSAGRDLPKKDVELLGQRNRRLVAPQQVQVGLMS